MRILILFFCLCAWTQGLFAADAPLLWPTPNRAFFEKKPVEDYIQGTAGNEASSGLFGGVRNNGYRFHEGLDMKAVRRSRRNIPLDDVFAALDGRVAYVNRLSGNSGYGNYVVLAHDLNGLELYTLYAHLASVNPAIQSGVSVKAGDTLGRLGRTAGGYRIGLEQAHIHFEIGVRLSDRFQGWYDRTKQGGKNHHGNYNGMNLIGMDPLPLFEAARDGTFNGFRAHIARLPRAFAMRVYTTKVPALLLRNPGLATRPVPANLAAWDVDFTWYAFPIAFTPRGADEVRGGKEGDIRILGYAQDLITAQKSRTTLVFDGGPMPRQGKTLTTVLQLLFNLK